MDSRLKTSLSILLAPKDLKLPDGNILTNQHRKIVANDLLDYLIRTNSFAKDIITPISYLLLNAEIIDSGLEKILLGICSSAPPYDGLMRGFILSNKRLFL